MPGLVMSDMGGGDFTFDIVDDTMWNQIKKLRDSEMTHNKFQECVSYFVCDQADVDYDENFPKPEGKVLHTYHSQKGVLELTPELSTICIRGILSIQL